MVANEWLYVVGNGANQSAFILPEQRLFCVELHGESIQNFDQLRATLANLFKFPNYLGHNWNALEDCLSDLEWLSADGYCIWWSEASTLLQHEPSAFIEFLSVMSSVAKWWSSVGKHFTLYICDDILVRVIEVLHDGVLLPKEQIAP